MMLFEAPRSIQRSSGKLVQAAGSKIGESLDNFYIANGKKEEPDAGFRLFLFEGMSAALLQSLQITFDPWARLMTENSEEPLYTNPLIGPSIYVLSYTHDSTPE